MTLRRRALVVAVLLAGCSRGGSDAERLDPDACRPGAVAACERACTGGDDGACDRVVLMYLQGTGVEKSDEKAAALERELCEGGRVYFCSGWAMALSEGRGVPKDRARARELFAAHCQHDPKGCGEYGNLYGSGTGVERDVALATFLLDQGCEHGDGQSCAELEALRRDGALESRMR